jgi:hypothetical protein
MPTILETKQLQLDNVRASIQKIEAHGQSYSISDGGAARTLGRANLAELYKREAALERDIARLSRGGIGVSYGVNCR